MHRPPKRTSMTPKSLPSLSDSSHPKVHSSPAPPRPSSRSGSLAAASPLLAPHNHGHEGFKHNLVTFLYPFSKLLYLSSLPFYQTMEKPDPLLPPCPSPSLFNHTKMHHPVTVIKFHNYIKSTFNLSNVLAWSINLYLFVVRIKTWYALLQV